ncbi:acyl carrier protein [Desulfovibrio desulfuricans]|nr:phosphopantetheine-binding protein [Desulfovibrio desulfuricans]MBD8894974.1 acyl carrier protein [Desulfovibrio desulfuricans]MCB6541829.1 phosphopantetheine-binding protein [Desulfovibrio desulfuricans]MCB6552905.1 phosphopantetheine-binding protein [Desulfovibrio desulfuricans]MCB6564748.1 phosphopantetheine-binding protein [Desulfovibrio desulfuricans]MCB7345935.1 phosphopantetheine-binding protein [Desulfovibrio desulfuricans]
MTKNEMESALKAAIIDGLRLEDVTVEDIDSSAPLFGDSGLMLDSLDAVELVVVVEKHFGVAIADAEEARKAFTSVSGLADFICARKAQA